MNSRIKVLVADDNAVDRRLLAKIIQQQGHQVIQAETGKQAIDCYLSDEPDIILMDVMMPELDGKEAARAIKELAGEKLVPIIFLTSLVEAQELADCLDSGGDDFLNKPYNHIILKAKVDAFVRMKNMHATLLEQRDTIARNNQHMLHEQHVAKAVFDNVAHSGCLNADNIRYLLSPLAVFNGDVLLAARKPKSGMHVFLGDFTGHGLPAAIGAMPMAEIFYGMTAKGFSLRDILREINIKLKNILPVGFFCCAGVVDLDFAKRDINIWMGGVPDSYLLSAEAKDYEVIRSHHLPLGVLGNEDFDDSMTSYDMHDGDRLFMCSDGIVEARDVNDDMFGEERLQAIFDQASSDIDLFEVIKQQVNDFIGGAERGDDTTLIELSMLDEKAFEHSNMSILQGPMSGPRDWSMDYELGVESLKVFNPLPMLLHIVMEVPGLRMIGGQLYTIMAELYSNAFEHGILELDSSLKLSANGFSIYYKERERLVSELAQGFVKISMKHLDYSSMGGCLIITMEDSGRGFDVKNKTNIASMGANTQLSGRGISLVDSLCHSLQYNDAGNKVTVEVHWP